MKSFIQYILQKVLGLNTYMVVFSWYKIKTLRKDRHENDFFHFLKFINKGDSVLVIGANIGIMSYYLSKSVGNGSVYAFEPIPLNVNTLRRIKRTFQLENLNIIDSALGNYDGTVEMILPVVDRVRKQGLSHVVTEEITSFNEGEKYTTEIHCLDTLNPGNGKRISAIKMDVENFEFHVLEGAKEILKRDKPIIYCELWDNQNRYNCFELMNQLGYSIQVLHQGKLAVYDSYQHTGQNFFFIPNSTNFAAS